MITNNIDYQNFVNTIDKDISLLLDNLPVGIIRLNSDKKCIYANKFVFQIFGINACNDFCNVSINHFNAIHPDDRIVEQRLCDDFIFRNIESESTFRIYHNYYQDYRWMSNKRTIIKSNHTTSLLQDKPNYMYTLQDIHDNKTLEIELRNASIKAEQANNHKSIFLANMSHEIRTPLNGVIGMLSILEDTKLSNEQQDYINMVKECSFNLMTIINDILDYSKLEIGKISLDIKEMSLQECIESTNDIMLSKIYEKSLEYNYNIDKDIPDILLGDSNRIKQVLLNLLTNSIKFTDRGTVYLNIETIKFSEYSRLMSIHYPNFETTFNQDRQLMKSNFDNEKESIFLRFDISDTGCGIDLDEYNKLFKSFSQIDQKISSKIYQGTGLGLAISKELVELMNGCIWLDWSETNKGSRFSFIIKLQNSYEPYYLLDNQNENILNNINVLIVDDNIYNRMSITGMVTKWGMKAYAFSNSEEALYFSKLTQFDIGLIDICMPKIDGITFANKLREQKEFNNKSFPLIALSSLGEKNFSLSRIGESSKNTFNNFSHHLIKPIKENKLKSLCIDILTKFYSPTKSQSSPIHSVINDHDYDNIKSSREATSSSTTETVMDIMDIRKNIKILLAEDIHINQRVIIKFLNKLGYYNITVVDDGKQCIEHACQENFDIILLDIRMPIINGEIAFKEIKKFFTGQNDKHSPYIIAVTAYCLREDREKYISMGFNDYLPKPIDFEDLNKCMNKFIENILSE